MAGNSVESGRSVTSKVTAILTAFTAGGAYSLSELARLTGLPTTTAHRILSELTSSRLLERTPDGGYRVGLPLRTMRGQPCPTDILAERGPHVLDDLAAAIPYPVRLGVLRDLRVAYLEARGAGPGCPSPAGARLPAHATAIGKVLLAFAPAATVRAVLAGGLPAFTEHTLTRPEQLRHALAVIRLTRFGTSDSELRPGVCALATPVFGPGGEIRAALEARVPDMRTGVDAVRPLLTVAARGLSRELSASCSEHSALAVARAS
jgi:DNA-binding IclR family transcriptional regulator